MKKIKLISLIVISIFIFVLMFILYNNYANKNIIENESENIIEDESLVKVKLEQYLYKAYFNGTLISNDEIKQEYIENINKYNYNKGVKELYFSTKFIQKYVDPYVSFEKNSKSCEFIVNNYKIKIKDNMLELNDSIFGKSTYKMDNRVLIDKDIMYIPLSTMGKVISSSSDASRKNNEDDYMEITKLSMSTKPISTSIKNTHYNLTGEKISKSNFEGDIKEITSNGLYIYINKENIYYIEYNEEMYKLEKSPYDLL